MTLSFRVPFCRFPSIHPKAKGAQPCNQGLHAFVRIGNGVTYFCKYATPLSRSWLDDIGIIAGFTKNARGFLQIIKKFLRHPFPAARPAVKHFATNSHTRFPYINIRCCSRTVIPAFFLFSAIVIQGTFLSAVCRKSPFTGRNVGRVSWPRRTAGCAQRIKSRRTARYFPLQRTIGNAARNGQDRSLQTSRKYAIIPLDLSTVCFCLTLYILFFSVKVSLFPFRQKCSLGIKHFLNPSLW